MAAVLSFPSQLISKREPAPHFGPGQVVIFNGVRVERLVDEVPPPRRNTRRPSAPNQAIAEDLE